MSTKIQDSLLPFIPLLYIAWADGILEESEIDYIEKQIKENTSLKPETKRILAKWLDPTNPPSIRELAYWKSYIKENADLLNHSEKLNLYSLGEKLAKGDSCKDCWVNEETKQSVLKIEDFLGLESHEIIRSAFEDGKISQESKSVNINTNEKQYVKPLKELLQHGNASIKEKVKKVLEPYKDEFENHDYDLNTRRERVLEWCQKLAKEGLGGLSYPVEYGGADSMAQYKNTSRCLFKRYKLNGITRLFRYDRNVSW